MRTVSDNYFRARLRKEIVCEAGSHFSQWNRLSTVFTGYGDEFSHGGYFTGCLGDCHNSTFGPDRKKIDELNCC